jgi:hypothetical protein
MLQVRLTRNSTRMLFKNFDSSVYQKPNVKSYVENTWMACEKRWAQAFRKQQAVNIVNTNNGVESQNKHFKYDYLPRAIDKSVYGVTVMLVESFLPDSYQYIDTNFKQSSAYRRYNDSVPHYLCDCPIHFIKHCTKSMFAAGYFREQIWSVLTTPKVNSVFEVLLIRRNMKLILAFQGMLVNHGVELSSLVNTFTQCSTRLRNGNSCLSLNTRTAYL